MCRRWAHDKCTLLSLLLLWWWWWWLLLLYYQSFCCHCYTERCCLKREWNNGHFVALQSRMFPENLIPTEIILTPSDSSSGATQNRCTSAWKVKSAFDHYFLFQPRRPDSWLQHGCWQGRGGRNLHPLVFRGVPRGAIWVKWGYFACARSRMTAHTAFSTPATSTGGCLHR